MSDEIWTLSGDLSEDRLQEIVDAINGTLLNHHVQHASLDTADLPSALLEATRTSLRRPAYIHSPAGGASRCLNIPTGRGISLRLKPLMFEGKAYPAEIMKEGSHISVRLPYFFYDDRRQVDYQFHLLTSLSGLNA